MRVRASVLFLSLLLVLVIGAALLPADQNAPARTLKLKVTAEQANLREKPDIGSSIVQQIPEGAILEADKKEGEWYFVRFTLEDGGVIGGWIHESLAVVVEPGEPVAAAVNKPGTEAPEPAKASGTKPAGSSASSTPLDVSVSLGLGTLAPRDLNNGTRGYADWYGASVGIPAPGAADILHLSVLAGFELSCRISRRLTLGLGVDFLEGSNGDAIMFTDDLVTETLSTKPSIRATPVKVTARFYPGAGLYIRGALGRYSVKAGYLFRQEGADFWEQWEGSAKATGFGGEAAFGGEWTIAPRAVFFVEAGFRMAGFGGFTGENVYTNSAGESLTEPGTLYFFHKTAGGEEAYPMVFVRESAPSEAGVVDARGAEINISGTAVRVGVRYRF